MADSIWWTKMLHKDFCAHYCEMSDSEIVADVRRSVASLMMQRSEGSDFGALMVRMAMERIAAKHETAVANGSQGGRPRNNQDTTADGDTREGSQGTRPAAAITRNEPLENDPLDSSATLSQDAADGNAADDSKAPTSCTNYDQGTDQVSTDEARESQALESRRTDGHSLRVGNVARPPVRSPGRKFRNKEEFIQWAIDTGLDPDDAGNCWEATMERGGLTKDGKKVDNICAYTVKWCRTSKKNRETA